MDKNDIENYLSKLKDFEKKLNSDNVEDLSVFSDIDKLLGLLSTDIMSTPEFNTQVKVPAVTVKIKKLHEKAVIPSYSKVGDAGMDLTITSIISETTTDVTYGFGIALEIPRGYVGLVFPRSSVRKYDLSLTNSVGVIDSGYRGEIQATFKKTNWLKGDSSNKYGVGDRGAQIIIIPHPNIELIEFKDLSSSDRGDGGFGSTGK
jgi:dUTP pyrophosphatase